MPAKSLCSFHWYMMFPCAPCVVRCRGNDLFLAERQGIKREEPLTISNILSENEFLMKSCRRNYSNSNNVLSGLFAGFFLFVFIQFFLHLFILYFFLNYWFIPMKGIEKLIFFDFCSNILENIQNKAWKFQKAGLLGL